MASLLKDITTNALFATEAYYVGAINLLNKHSVELKEFILGAGVSEISTALTHLIDGTDALRRNLEAGLRDVRAEIATRQP